MLSPRWRVFYEDCSFDDTEIAPEDAPLVGVQCIVQRDPDVGRQIMHGWDFYHFCEGQWWGADIHGVLGRLYLCKPVFALKAGLSSHVFKEIYERAKLDPDFPVKSASKRGETP